MNGKRNNIGFLLFAVTIMAIVGLPFILTSSGGMGPAAAVGLVVVAMAGLAIIACLALVSLMVGWNVKFIRYSVLGVVGLIALAFPLSMVSDAIGERRNVKTPEPRNSLSSKTSSISSNPSLSSIAQTRNMCFL